MSEANPFREMEKRWPSNVVARSEVERFTGGAITSKYLANLDAQGLGPERFRLGRKVVYPVRPFIAWLVGRSHGC